MRIFFLIVLMLLLTACDGGASAYIPLEASTPLADLPVSRTTDANRAQPPTPVSQDVINAADAEYLLLTNLYERITPSIVNIETVSDGETLSEIELNGGSGFIYDRAGHIITNAHVVRDADEIRVTFNDGYLKTAQLVGSDSYSDLAVLKVEVESSRLMPLALGDSDTLRVGQRAVAIGNPFGLASSMTVGIISGLGRQLGSAALIEGNLPANFQNPSIIQVDAQINPGNSGGPLLNSNGEVIGVNTAIRSGTGAFQGVGFAVPANTIKRVVPELIEKGRVDYPWLGISAMGAEGNYSVTSLAETLNLPVDSGVLVSTVTRNSPAAKAGIQGGSRQVRVREQDVCVGGDIIVAIDGVYVDNIDELVAHMVINNKPGDTVNLLVVRDDQTFEVPVTLETRTSSSESSFCGS